MDQTLEQTKNTHRNQLVIQKYGSINTLYGKLFTYWTVYAVGSTWNAWFKSWIKKSEGRLLCVSTSLHIHNAKRTHTHCSDLHVFLPIKHKYFFKIIHSCAGNCPMQSSLKPNHFSIHSYVGFLNSRPLYKLFSLLQNVAFSCIKKTQCINRMMHQKWDNKYKCSQNCCIHSNTKQVHDQPNQ